MPLEQIWMDCRLNKYDDDCSIDYTAWRRRQLFYR
uniref:Uncharacterized protein n=1 Tax=Cucumis melo TaxID=3656 RepID=A0A9I9E338_CUCME